MYAVYTYESMQFEPAVRDFVADTLRQWTSIYVRKFQEVIDRYPPAMPVTARQLAEMIVSIIEGGLVLQRAYGDVRHDRRVSRSSSATIQSFCSAAPKKKSRERDRATRPAPCGLESPCLVPAYPPGDAK